MSKENRERPDARHRAVHVTTSMAMPPTLPAPSAPPIDTRPARTDAAIRFGAALAVAAGLLLVTWWWVVGGGARRPDQLGRRPDVGGPADRPGRVGPVAGAGPADGPHPAGGARGRAGPARAVAPLDRVHLVQPDARARHADHLGLRRRRSRGRPGDILGPHGHLPGHAPRPGRHGVPGPGVCHQRPGRPPPAALRVVAPAAPLRLPRRRARPAPPAVDRAGVPLLDRRHRVLVDTVDRGDGGRARAAGSGCRCSARCGTAYG